MLGAVLADAVATGVALAAVLGTGAARLICVAFGVAACLADAAVLRAVAAGLLAAAFTIVAAGAEAAIGRAIGAVLAIVASTVTTRSRGGGGAFQRTLFDEHVVAAGGCQHARNDKPSDDKG